MRLCGDHRSVISPISTAESHQTKQGVAASCKPGATTRCRSNDLVPCIYRCWNRAYLRLCGSRLIVTVGGGAKRSTGSVFASSDTTALSEIVLALGLSDLNLLLLATTTELLRLEGALCLELGSAMLGDVAISHGGWICICFGGEEGLRGDKNKAASQRQEDAWEGTKESAAEKLAVSTSGRGSAE